MTSVVRGTTCALKRALFLFVGLILLVSQAATAQSDPPLNAGDPGPNVNVVGPTVVEDPWDIRDVGLKQQNEPACGIRPGNPACILCAYNDNRTVDVPAVGDGWISMSTSCDFGTTWTSRPVPGHNAHPAPIGETFAADPRLVVLPGVAILGFIAGDRDSDRGVAAVQFWPEINREDADHYEPALNTVIVETGSEGRFVDKPELFAVLDPPHKQQPVTLSFEMEDPDLGTITRTVPSGKLYMAWATFTGGGGSKIFYKVSTDWGQTWKNQASKLSEEQNLVSGIAMTGMGEDVIAVWRRVGDNNDFDDILASRIFQGGKKATKGEVVASICSFDQIGQNTGTSVTFRTNDFPWLANDGNNYFLFYSDRGFGGDCATGRPRIVFKQSTDGLNWSQTATPVDDSVLPLSNGETPAGDGFQFMPVAFGANGEIRVSWYDTRREILPAATEALPTVTDNATDPEATAVFRQLDVYTTRLRSDGPGMAPEIAEPIRVTQFPIAAEIESAGEGGGEVDNYQAIEAEASFPNLRLYASGSLSFIGDYIATAAEAFRLAGDEAEANPDAWIPNSSLDPSLPLTDYIVAWGDNRDVRGSVFAPDFTSPTPYSPPAGATAGRIKLPTDLLDADSKEPTLRAEGVPGNDDFPIACTPGAPEDRTRDANIYASLVEDRLKVYATTPAKPLTNLLRAFAIGITNDEFPIANPDDPAAVDPGRNLRLYIAGQPCDATAVCRASFNQVPSVPPFAAPVPFAEGQGFIDLTVPPRSTLARTIFVFADADSRSVPIELYDGDCAAANPDDFFEPGVCELLATISVGGSGTAGTLEQPFYDSPVCADVSSTECTNDVLRTELHNPQLINPQLINDPTQNPQLINLSLSNPQLINPQLINPQLINPQLINFGYENPQLINPQLINPQLINDGVQNPQLINPQLINPQLINPQLINTAIGDSATTSSTSTAPTEVNWVDFTFAIQNTGNVTTAFDADLTIFGEGLENTDSQFIAWTVYAAPTADECQYVGEADVRVLAQVNAPDNDLDVANINEPFNGELSAIAAPGQILYFTRRVFGSLEDLQSLSVSALTAASQAANCRDDENEEYFCEATLADNRERILIDTTPPAFNLANNTLLPAISADRPGGACVDLVGDGTVTADDNGEPVLPTCVSEVTGSPVCVTGGTTPPSDGLLIPLTEPEAPLGIICTASDDNGNEASVRLLVNVFDTGTPELGDPLVPGPLVVTASANLPPENPLTAVVAYPEIDAVDNPVVDEDVEVICFPESGSEFPIGQSAVSCTARDDGPNGNLPPELTFNESEPVEFMVSVVDVTPPVGEAPTFNDDDLQANTTGGRENFVFPLPIFTDNDIRDTSEVTVSCTPAPGFFLPLSPSTSISCTGTDASGNESSVSFEVAAVDTLGPIVTPPSAQPVTAAIGGDGFARPDLESFVTVVDQFGVDPDPVASCQTSGGATTGDALEIGSYRVTCTATDASGNVAEEPAEYDLLVQYGSGAGIFVDKNNVKSGSSVPLRFGWRGADGQLIDSSGADPVVSARDCATQSNLVLNPGEFPGNSDLRYDASQKLWKFNWQTVDMSGQPIPADTYCLRAESRTTGQTVPDSGFTEVRVRR